jgi:hypothetical protein
MLLHTRATCNRSPVCYNTNAMRMDISQRDILIWHKTMTRYDRKPYTQYGVTHLIGYLRRCADIGELQPDPYVNQWRECVKLIIKRDRPETDELKLISLYHALEQTQD